MVCRNELLEVMQYPHLVFIFLFGSTIMQKVLGGFGKNFLGRLDWPT